MRLKSIIYEDYVNYRVPSLFLGTCYCDWKCCREAGVDVCQNAFLASYPIVELPDREIVGGYLSDPLTHAVVIGGLEPFMQAKELACFIRAFRDACDDDIVIYTGYTLEELSEHLERLMRYTGIVLKVGRYIPGQTPHYDAVLGVELASDNQRGVRIS